MTFRLREATPADVPDLLRLVRELATYEKEPDAVITTEADFHTAMFDGEPTAFAHVAEVDGPDGPRVVGMAVWYLTFSTWAGQGIWLEDLYVEPGERGSGIGTALLATLARVCVERGYRRLEWWVLDWNTPAIEIYEGLGARPYDGIATYRLSGEALAQLGA